MSRIATIVNSLQDAIFYHTKKTPYKNVEGLSILLVPVVTLVALLMLLLVVLIITSCVHGCKTVCRKCCKENDTDTNKKTCCSMCKKIRCCSELECTHCMKTCCSASKICMMVKAAICFANPSLLHVEESENGTVTATPRNEENENGTATPRNEENENGTATLKVLGAKVKKGYAEVWVYIYFGISLAIGLIWFLALFSDQAFYKKITTCNDIDVTDTSKVCFNLKQQPGLDYGAKVDCMNQTPAPEAVICYQFAFSPFMSFGAAFGFFLGFQTLQRILVHVVVFLTKQKKDFLNSMVISLQISLFLVGFASLVALSVVGNIQANSVDVWKYNPFLNFFFYGLQPMKIVMFACFVLTYLWSALLPFIPWYALEEPAEADRNRQTEMTEL